MVSERIEAVEVSLIYVGVFQLTLKSPEALWLALTSDMELKELSILGLHHYQTVGFYAPL